MKKIFITLSAFLIALGSNLSQPLMAQSINKYLGQAPPQNTVKRFPPDNLQMLAVNGVWMWHGSPSFSPDLKEVFFVKYLNPVNRTEIWHSRLVNNLWTLPVQASFGNQMVIENCPVFSPGGDTLYFYSQRPGNPGIFMSMRQADHTWSAAQHLISIPNSGWNLSIAKNRNLYVEITETAGNDDIYCLQWKNGNYLPPERLPDQINTLSNESAPYTDPNEEYLMFISNRTGGSGLHDMYISFRNRDGSWGQAVTLGTWINSSQEDGFPVISPDGKYLFYNTARNSSNDQGYNPYWVSASFIDQMRPLEPDTSSRVAFYSDRDGNAEIYSMYPDGSSIKRLTNNLFTDIDPAWSGDGIRIAFASDREGNFELYTMKSDGGDVHKLTNTGKQVGTPDCSQDGTLILFTVTEDTYSTDGEIGIINSDGTGYQIITAAGTGSGATWSDDGSKIIFCSSRTGDSEIYIMDADGTNLLQVTRSQTNKQQARLSPDGSLIVYTVVTPDGTDTRIHLMRADGSGDIQLTGTERSSKNPSWSADGSQIYFQTGRFGNQEIYTMDVNGRFQTNITRNLRNDLSPDYLRKSSISGIPVTGFRSQTNGLKTIWPNPAGNSVRIEFSTLKPGKAGLVLTDILGRHSMELPRMELPAGDHSFQTNLKDLPAGVYVVMLSTADGISSKRLLKR